MALRVLTLNIWNRNDPWAERLTAIRAGVEEHQPDLIGLQEVLKSRDPSLGPGQENLIASGLGYETVFGAAWEMGGVDFGNAILSRWPILRSRVFPLPSAGAEESRCLLFAEIDAPFGKIPFFVTHLSWRPHEGHIREAQVRKLTDHIEELFPFDPARSSESFPPVLVGDFNAEPEADEIRFLRGHCSLGGKSVHFTDAFAHAGDGSLGATFSRRNPFAAPLREPDRRIDYIFVRGLDAQGRGEPCEARVVFDEPFQGVFPTDHFGVLATLRSEPEP